MIPYISIERLNRDLEDTRDLLRVIMIWWALCAVGCLICLHLILSSTGIGAVVWFLIQFVLCWAFFILNREMWGLVRQMRHLAARARLHVALNGGGADV